jgi:hypothetical protein
MCRDFASPTGALMTSLSRLSGEMLVEELLRPLFGSTGLAIRCALYGA